MSAHKALPLIFLFAFLFSCAEKKQATIGGIQVPTELLRFADKASFDYAGQLDKAIKGNVDALQSVLVFCGKTEEGIAELHVNILDELKQKLGDEKFSFGVRKMGQAERMSFLTEILPRQKTWKSSAPETWQAIFPDKEISEQKGLYVFSRNRLNTFQSCENPDELLIAIDGTGEIEKNYLRLLQKPYPGQALFAELKGFSTPAYADFELASNHAGFFVVTEILELGAKNYSNTCVPYLLWGMGEKADWQVQISEAERLIEFKSPNRLELYHFPFSNMVETDTATICESVNEDSGDNIRIVIKDGECEWDMPEVNFSHMVNVSINGEMYSGCGFPFNE